MREAICHFLSRYGYNVSEDDELVSYVDSLLQVNDDADEFSIISQDIVDVLEAYVPGYANVSADKKKTDMRSLFLVYLQDSRRQKKEINEKHGKCSQDTRSFSRPPAQASSQESVSDCTHSSSLTSTFYHQHHQQVENLIELASGFSAVRCALEKATRVDPEQNVSPALHYLRDAVVSFLRSRSSSLLCADEMVETEARYIADHVSKQHAEKLGKGALRDMRDIILSNGYDLEAVNYIDSTKKNSKQSNNRKKDDEEQRRRSNRRLEKSGKCEKNIRYRDGCPVSYRGEKIIIEGKGSSEKSDKNRT